MVRVRKNGEGHDGEDSGDGTRRQQKGKLELYQEELQRLEEEITQNIDKQMAISSKYQAGEPMIPLKRMLSKKNSDKKPDS